MRFGRSGCFGRALTALAVTLAVLGGAGGAAAADGNVGGIRITMPRGLTVSGRVVSTDGRPLAGATVIFHENRPNPTTIADLVSNDSGLRGTTDRTGRYVVRGLAKVPYWIEVDPQSPYQHGWFRVGRSSNFTPYFTNATRLAVSTNRSGLDFVLPPGGTIAGHVRAADGTPANAFTIAFKDAVTGEQVALGGTDRSGRFAVRGLAPGAYDLAILNISVAGGLCLQDGYYAADAPGHWVVSPSAASTVYVRDRTSVGTITLPAGRTLSGRLTSATGDPIANAQILLMGAETPAFGALAPLCFGATDEDGRWSLPGITERRYSLAFQTSADALPDGSWDESAPGHYSPAFVGSPFRVTADRAGMDITVPPPSTIRGRLVGADGAPLAGVEVRAMVALGSTPATSLDARVAASVETDEDGAFVLTGLAGPVAIRIEDASGFDDSSTQGGWYAASAPGGFAASSRDATLIAAPDDLGPLEIHVPAGFRVTGRVKIPGEHAMPIDVTAECVADPGRSVTRPARDGDLWLIGLSPCAYRLRVDPIDFPSRPGRAGWYARGLPGNWTGDVAKATLVRVGAP